MALLLRPEDFARLTGFIQPDGRPCPAVRAAYPEIDVVPDRFGVVHPGKVVMVQTPAADAASLSSFRLLRERVELADDRIMAMRYSYETCLRQPPVFFGVDFGYVFTAKERWNLKWRVSRKIRESMQRCLDRRSNVRRMKRHAELNRRGAAR